MGLKSQCFTILGYCVINLSERFVCISEVVVRFGVIRFDRKCALVASGGPGGIALIHVDITNIVVCLREVRFQCERQLKMVDRVVQFSLCMQREASATVLLR